MDWYAERINRGVGMSKIICPDCGAKMVLRKTTKFTYADKSPRYFYGCSNYPKCKATHGANPDGSPLGIPANDETKKYRILAHNAFDPIWKNRKMKRQDAYKWLTEQLEMKTQAHIGAMNIEECKKVIEVCRVKNKRKESTEV